MTGEDNRCRGERFIHIDRSWKIITLLIATGFGIGFIPLAPATFACLLCLPVWFFLKSQVTAYLLVTVLLFFLGVLTAHALSRIMGKDPRAVVVDEYACFLLPLYFTPVRLLPLVITFVLFRIFDVIKPFPLRRLEKIPGGWGIMLDDLGAAVYTTLVILVLRLPHVPGLF